MVRDRLSNSPSSQVCLILVDDTVDDVWWRIREFRPKPRSERLVPRGPLSLSPAALRSCPELPRTPSAPSSFPALSLSSFFHPTLLLTPFVMSQNKVRPCCRGDERELWTLTLVPSLVVRCLPFVVGLAVQATFLREYKLVVVGGGGECFLSACGVLDGGLE